MKSGDLNESKNKIIILNMISTIILNGLAFVSGPIFSGILGTDNYGIAAVYLTWVQIASTVFSLQAGGTVALARGNFPIKDQGKYQSSVLSLASISYCIFSILTIIVSCMLQFKYKLNILMILFGLVQGWGMYCVSFMNSKLAYEFEAVKNCLLSILTSSLTIGLSLVLIISLPRECNYWGRVIGQSAVYAVLGFIIFAAVFKSGKTCFKAEYWGFTLPIAIPTIFHLLAGIVLNQSDKVMIQGMINNSAAGIYALAATFGAVLSAIWNAFNNSWVPYYYEYSRQNQIKEIKKHAYNYIELFTLITVGFILLSREVFHIYAKEMFWEGTDFIPLFAVGYYFVFLYSFPVNFEFYSKETKTIAIGTTLAAGCNIILNYVLIYSMGVIGAVIATATSHGLQFVFHYFNAKKIKSEQFPFSLYEFIPGILVVFSACFIYLFTKEQWMIRWGIGAALGIYMLIKIIRRGEIF